MRPPRPPERRAHNRHRRMTPTPRAVIWIRGAALLYCCLAAFAWLSDPMAMAPQLDAGENIDLANRINEGTNPVEPFYRAMLYPWTLSLFPFQAALPSFAVFLGLVLHIGSAFLTGVLAREIWQSKAAGNVAVVLQAINPVSLFFALQVLDMALGIFLFMAALVMLLVKDTRRAMVIGGLLAGLACMARPHFLPAAILLPIVPLLQGTSHRPSAWLNCVGIAAGLATVLAGHGLINRAHSGEFRILPWQGSYNLYAANRDGANGLYYKQTIDVSSGNYTNPAREESEMIYGMETGETPPYDIDQMNRFWKDRFIGEVLHDPGQWIGLVAFKAYAVLNNFEQYNNLTYDFHKARLPHLRYNPLGWGLLLVSGSLGFLILSTKDWRKSGLLLILILGYSVSLLLYYASARFRLPLVPLMTILAVGPIVHFRQLLTSRRRIIFSASVAAGSAVLAFSAVGPVKSGDTHIQDRLLLANANARVSRDAEAADLSLQVLAEQPGRREALRTYSISYFNLQLEQSPERMRFGDWNQQRDRVPRLTTDDPAYESVYAFYLWNWGNPSEATDIWLRHRDKSPLAAEALKAIGPPAPGHDGTHPLLPLLGK
jgi:hypothetical protein